ncbi:MAG: glycerophosphodiester phosphodiesterase [Burkholderiales bacterium]
MQIKLPIVIGHRGASGYLPEHTLEGYALAIELGADYIEPDLVVTSDGYLIARHEPNMINTTNVKDLPQFAARKRTAVVSGVLEEGFFASDFTLDEIKTLGGIQQVAERDSQFNGLFKIPTLDEIIALAKRKSLEKNRPIGIYPETKHPTYHQALGLALEDRLLVALTRAGWNHRDAPVFIQSFETANLKYLRTQTQVKLVQLIAAYDVDLDGSLAFNTPFDRPYDWIVAGRLGVSKDWVTPAGLAEIKTYADGIGAWKPYVISSAGTDANGDSNADDLNGDGLVIEADRKLLPATKLIQAAHQAGLFVHAWTFSNEPRCLEANYHGNPISEYLRFYELGIDGVFSDFPDTAVTARTLFGLARERGYAKRLVNDPNEGEK